MSMKDILADYSLRASPGIAWLGSKLAAIDLPTLVTVATGVYMVLQIYKAILDIRAAKRKEKAECKPSDNA